MSYRPLVIAALLGAAAAQPDAQCNTEVMTVIMGSTTVSTATCAALATLEGCIARVTDRAEQSALEITLGGYQAQMQGCSAAPVTAAIRTARDEVEVTGAQVVFARTVRQLVNVHELQEQVNTNEDALSASIASVEAAVTSTLAANTAVMQSQMDAAASTATLAQSSLMEAMSRLTATTDARVDAQLSAAAAANVVAAQQLNAQLAAAASASAVTTSALNASVRAAIVAANNAAVPQVYIQWGSKSCTAPTGVQVRKFYDGITYGTRHNYNGGGGNQLCLRNAAGDQGGVRQGGHDSNDILVPLRMDHTNYNGIPSRNNLLRSRESHIIPCAKCQYAKSCFTESGVEQCPSGYHKMYTGYFFAGHQSHHGNNNRICLDKNPGNSDYTSSQWWEGVIYPTLAKDGTGPGLSRNNNVVPACHKCCVH